MARSTSFAPASPPGNISRIIMTSWATDAEFKSRLKLQIAQVNEWLDSLNGPANIVTQAANVASGPFCFVVTTHPPGGTAEVKLFHAMRMYLSNPMDIIPADPELKDKCYGFNGEIHLEDGIATLSEVFVRPENFEAVLTPGPVKVPNEVDLLAAFATYDENAGETKSMAELMPGRLASTTMNLPMALVVPSFLLPLLIEGQTLRQAYLKVTAVVNEFEEADRVLFDKTLAYFRASCVKLGGRTPSSELSLMASNWAPPAASNSRAFRTWKTSTLRLLYPTALEGVSASQPTNQAMGGTPDLFHGLSEVMKTGVEAAASKYEQFRTVAALEKEAAEPDSKWSPLVQDMIIRAHGLPQGTTWDSPHIMPIWDAYEKAIRGAGNSESDIQRIFMSRLPGSRSMEQGFEKAPNMTRATAKDIKAGRLGPIAGVLTYENCDQGLLPLAFVERTHQQLVDEAFEDEDYAFEDEDYDRATHRTIEVERNRSSRLKSKKAPASFDEAMSLIKTYGRVVAEHFSKASPLYQAVALVWETLASHETLWRIHMSPTAGARLFWQLTRVVWPYLTTTSWGPSGAAPSIDVAIIVLGISGGSILPVADLPSSLVKTTTTAGTMATSGLLSGGATFGGGAPPPSPPAAPGIERVNNSVDPRVRAMLAPAVAKLGTSSKFSTLIGFAAQAGHPVRYPEVVLSSEDCNEYMTVGRCTDARCTRKHSNTAPDPARVQTFLDKMQPVIGYILATPLTELRSRRRRRPATTNS